MGRSGKKSVLASLFGLKNKRQQQQEEEEAAAASAAARQQQQQQQQRHYRGTRVRLSDDDDCDYYGRHWYADPDINRRASEFIDRVHRGMLANDQDG